MFKLQSFTKLRQIGKVCSVNVLQCALGPIVLVEHVYKNATSWASHINVLEAFRLIKCTCRRRGAVEGSNKSKLAPV